MEWVNASLRQRKRTAAWLGAAAVLAVVAGGGWAESGEAATPPLPHRESGVVAPSDEAAGEVIIEGATTTVLFPRDGGTMWLAVQRNVDGDRQEQASLIVERGGSCVLHRVHGNSYNADCGVLWTVERKIPAAAFEPNPATGEAELDVRVKGKRLRVKWQGQGVPQVKTDAGNGYLLLQTQDAKAGVRWGSTSWAWPDDFGSKHAGTGLLYRRVEGG